MIMPAVADKDQENWQAENFRAYLHMLARSQFDSRFPRFRDKFDSSDFVQETLLKAQQHIRQFRGHSEAEFRSWLQEILANVMSNEIGRFLTKKRAIDLERSLDASFADTSARLESLIQGNAESPSNALFRQEKLRMLDVALNRLPDDQRAAIEFRYFHGDSVKEIAEAMSRTTAAVAGLLRRGLQALRHELERTL